MSDLAAVRKKCAKRLLELYYGVNAGHVGASLSCLEILIELQFRQMGKDDVLILSKGHAAAGLYVTLAESGKIEASELETFYKDGTRLAAHPPCSGEIAAIPFGTGSLGHGLSLAAGIAFSQKFTHKNFHVYCVLSDGECDEGSTWEAALFAAHHKLGNLTVIVDRNNLQGIGTTEQVLNLEPFDSKWKSFGFSTVIAPDGNSFDSLQKAIQTASSGMEQSPKCVIARTKKGHGVSFMENKMEWHYHPMNAAQFQQAIKELDSGNA